MSNNDFKIIEDFGNTRKSERRKYLETMMADMGLTSLNELSPEEQKRWLKACRPDPMVEKKLKEMGYSIHSNTNKPSLGALNISGFYKTANLAVAASDLTISLKDFRETLKAETSYEIIKILSSKRLQDKNFDSNLFKRDIENIISQMEDDLDFFKFFIEDLVQKASKYNSEYLKITDAFVQPDLSSMEETLSNIPDLQIQRDHENRDQIVFIQNKLESLGYTLDIYGVDGKFGPETEDAVILFQQENGLSATGVITPKVFEVLVTNPKPLSVESRREHKRRLRQERKGERAGDSGGSWGRRTHYGDLQNVSFTSSRVDVDGSSPMLQEYLKMLDEVAEEKGGKIQITSAYRSPYHQARIMWNNYKARGAGSNRANKYLLRLYGKFPRIREIVNIYSGSGSVQGKRRAAEEIIEASWAKRSHLGGKSVDIRLGNKIQDILEETQDLATVDILRESDHWHVSIKSLTPGGIPRGKIRYFRG